MAVMGRPKSENPKKNVLTVRLVDEDFQLVIEYATNHNLSISELMRKAVLEYIGKLEQ